MVDSAGMLLKFLHGLGHIVTFPTTKRTLQDAGLFMGFRGLLSDLLLARGAYVRFGRQVGFFDMFPESHLAGPAGGALEASQDGFVCAHVRLESSKVPECCRTFVAFEDWS